MDQDYVLVPRPNDCTALYQPSPVILPAIDAFIQSLEPLLWPLNSYIHSNPELAYKEFKAHDALTRFMKSRSGWHVTCSAYGMETAWEAVYDTARPGPVVSFNVEMDALPDLGHACGHNLIAVASIAAGLATAEMLRRENLAGKVVIVGTPAEEGGAGGKIRCLEAGAYVKTDVSLISHPGILNNSPMVRTTAYSRLDVSYRGRSAHSARNPWDGVNALDAAVVAYTAVSTMRQQTRADDVIALQITNGGGRPSLIHEHAAVAAVLRASSARNLRQLQCKVEGCFRAGGQAAGIIADDDVDLRVTPGYLDHVPNAVLARSFARCWEALPGPPPEPPLPPPGQFTWVKASTDQGNLSYALPSMNVSFAIPPGPHRGQPHSRDFELASGTRAAFNCAMRVAKAMAGTAIDVFTVPGLLEEIKQQWCCDMSEQGDMGRE